MSVLALLKMSPWLAILMLLGIVAYQGSQIHKWHNQTLECSAARHADQQSYAQAQSDAQAKNKAQVAKVKTEQERITGNVEKSYEADLARLRAERLRSPSGAPASPSRGPGAGKPGTAPGGPAPEAVPLSSDDLLQAQETELQLNALIDWVEGQAKVDPNK